MSDTFTKFDYLLNASEAASQHANPASVGYGDKRRALYAYVRDLEARAERAEAAPASRESLSMVGVARRNIRQYVSKASFSSAVDKEAAIACLDVLDEALERAEAAQPTSDERDALRDDIGQAISDKLTEWYSTEDGTIGVDPFDSRNIDEIADAVMAVLAARAAPVAEAAQRVPLTDATALLRQAHDALDGMSDTDLDYFEDEEEEAEALPAQYAARKVMQAIQMLQQHGITATEPKGERDEPRKPA